VILLSHPTANQNVRQTALALAEAGLLAEFWTCINWRENGALDQLLTITPRIRNELRRRSFASELQPFIKTSPSREWGRQFSGQLGLRFLARNESGIFSMDAVYHSLDRHVAQRLSSLPAVKAVYAYDGGALETFRAAKKLGLKCVYEHPIVHWRKVRELQCEEAERNPKWASTLLGLRDSDEKLARKDEELTLADFIITPGKFSRESLALAPNLKAELKVIPYGAPQVVSKTDSNRGNRLRVLFVGALSQAKGLGYLLDAVVRVGSHVELTLIGHRVAADVPAPQLLDRHRWIQSLPHDQLLEEMSRHDVLVFPSLHEGFGLVILEAMAQGIPVIATPNTGGVDVIDDGIDGFIIPIRSSDAIAAKLQLLYRDRAQLEAMKEAARRKADACSWPTYRQHLVALARELIAN
jgi:alpha-maltose-1-phosphate synthase